VQSQGAPPTNAQMEGASVAQKSPPKKAGVEGAVPVDVKIVTDEKDIKVDLAAQAATTDSHASVATAPDVIQYVAP